MSVLILFPCRRLLSRLGIWSRGFCSAEHFWSACGLYFNQHFKKIAATNQFLVCSLCLNTSTRIYSTHNRCTEDEIQAVMTPANRIIPQRDHCWIFLVVRTETKRKVVPGNESSFGSEVFVSLLSSGLKLIGSFLQHVVILLCFLCFTVCFASLPVLFCVNQRQGR